MFRKLTGSAVLAVVAIALLASNAFASVTFVPADGTGFVGKGDVQNVLGMNNYQIQNASLTFTYESTVVTEVSWVCTKDGVNEQERARTTTTSISGVVSSVARVKNQITGYNLNGFNGTPVKSSETEGPAINSCPSSNSGYELTTPAGDPQVVSTEGGLFVNNVLLPITG